MFNMLHKIENNNLHIQTSQKYYNIVSYREKNKQGELIA